jgi:hypothetical protein
LAVLREALGADLGDRVYQAACMGALEGAVRERDPKGGRANVPRVTWRDDLHGDAAPHLRRIAHFALVVLQRCGTDSGKAVSNKLWLGRTRHEGKYVRGADAQRGLAAIIGVTVKELERYEAILEAAGVWHVWQPMERDEESGSGVRAPKRLKRAHRGEVYAYNQYQLIGPMPRVMRDNLERFYRKGKKSPLTASTPAPAAPSSPSGAAGDDFGGFATDVRELLKKGTELARERGRDPPS